MSIKINQFYFYHICVGEFKVTYTNPKTKVSYISIITDMDLIDNTKNKFKPKVEDLKTLKSKILNYDNLRTVHPISIRNSNQKK